MDAYNYLNTIECVYCVENPNNVLKYFVHSDNMQHISKMIIEQKPSQPKPFRPQRDEVNRSINVNDCYFKDNIVYKHMRFDKLTYGLRAIRIFNTM